MKARVGPTNKPGDKIHHKTSGRTDGPCWTLYSPWRNWSTIVCHIKSNEKSNHLVAPLGEPLKDSQNPQKIRGGTSNRTYDRTSDGFDETTYKIASKKIYQAVTKPWVERIVWQNLWKISDMELGGSCVHERTSNRAQIQTSDVEWNQLNCMKTSEGASGRSMPAGT